MMSRDQDYVNCYHGTILALPVAKYLLDLEDSEYVLNTEELTATLIELLRHSDGASYQLKRYCQSLEEELESLVYRYGQYLLEVFSLVGLYQANYLWFQYLKIEHGKLWIMGDVWPEHYSDNPAMLNFDVERLADQELLQSLLHG